MNIKFRKDRQLETMARLDPTYAELKRAIAEKDLPSDKQAEIKAKMTERETLLLPVYSQISLQFADLHDRAGRMEAKNTIRHPIQWKNARRFFYWRVRRRLNEEKILKAMSGATMKAANTRANNLLTLRAWTNIADFEKDDMSVATWCEENRQTVKQKVEAIKSEGVAMDMAGLLRGDKQAGLKGFKTALSMMPVEEREETLKFLSSK